MRQQMKQRPNGKAESGARYSMFVTLTEGLSTLVDAIIARLPPESIRLNSPIEKIERSGNIWRLSPAGTEQFLEFDALIVAVPAHRASPLLAPIDAELAS